MDKSGEYKNFVQKNTYTIPLRCFIPLKVKGLLLNGRNISGTHKAHSSYRVMPIVMNMGQAMGVVAAQCINEQKEPLELDIHAVQAALLAQKVVQP